jgi:hypothetical protein
MPRHPPYALNSLTIKKSSTLSDRVATFACHILSYATLYFVYRISLMQLSKNKKIGEA